MRGPAMAMIYANFVTLAMRSGYAARGVVYFIVGTIALTAAARGGRAEGLLGSLGWLKGQPWNDPILLALAAGLALYAVWRGLDALLDLAGHGRGFGWVERGGLVFVAILHAAFAWYAVKLAIGGASFAAESGSRLAVIVSDLVRGAFGRWFVVLAGVGTVSFGFYSIQKGIRSPYLRHMRRTPALERVVPLLGFGLVARGIVLAVMGGFIVWAGWTLDPDAAGGYGHALAQIRRAWQGRALLGVAGAGVLAFSLYCFVEAIYRFIPNLPGCPESSRGHPACDLSAR